MAQLKSRTCQIMPLSLYVEQWHASSESGRLDASYRQGRGLSFRGHDEKSQLSHFDSPDDFDDGQNPACRALLVVFPRLPPLVPVSLPLESLTR